MLSEYILRSPVKPAPVLELLILRGSLGGKPLEIRHEPGFAARGDQFHFRHTHRAKDMDQVHGQIENLPRPGSIPGNGGPALPLLLCQCDATLPDPRDAGSSVAPDTHRKSVSCAGFRGYMRQFHCRCRCRCRSGSARSTGPGPATTPRPALWRDLHPPLAQGRGHEEHGLRRDEGRVVGCDGGKAGGHGDPCLRNKPIRAILAGPAVDIRAHAVNGRFSR